MQSQDFFPSLAPGTNIQMNYVKVSDNPLLNSSALGEHFFGSVMPIRKICLFQDDLKAETQVKNESMEFNVSQHVWCTVGVL